MTGPVVAVTVMAVPLEAVPVQDEGAMVSIATAGLTEAQKLANDARKQAEEARSAAAKAAEANDKEQQRLRASLEAAQAAEGKAKEGAEGAGAGAAEGEGEAGAAPAEAAAPAPPPEPEFISEVEVTYTMRTVPVVQACLHRLPSEVAGAAAVYFLKCVEGSVPQTNAQDTMPDSCEFGMVMGDSLRNLEYAVQDVFTPRV